MRQAIKLIIRAVCPSLLPPLQKGLGRLRRLMWDDAWLVLPVALPEDKAWLRRLEALAATPPKAKPVTGGQNRHLVLVTGSLNPGGAERQWCRLALELSERGYSVTLLCLHSLDGDCGHYLPLLEKSAVTAAAMKEMYIPEDMPLPEADGIPRNAWEVAVALEALRPARVIAQMDYNNVWCGAATLLQEHPAEYVILSFRNKNPTNFFFNEPYYYDCYRQLLQSPRFLLNANSRSSAEDYAAWLGFNPDRVCIAHNAVNVPEPSPLIRTKIRRNLGIAESAAVVLGVFRLSAEKNPMLFLDVACTVHEALPEVVFLHAGIGAEEETLEDAIRKRGISSWFRLLGRRTDVAELMQAADVLLLCSAVEGLPNVILEAQAVGLPVVAARVGGVPDAVREGESALLAESGNHEQLCRHCLELLRDPQRRACMGRAGRRFVQTEFTAKALGDAILDQAQLPRRLSEPPAFAPTPQEGLPPGVCWLQARLELLLKKEPSAQSAPLLLFASFPLPSGAVSRLPAGSVCLTLPEVRQPAGCPAFQLDWRTPESCVALADIVPRKACAVVFEEWPHWQDIERELQQLGIRWVFCHGGLGWYRFPVMRPRIVRDVRGLGRGIRKRFGRRSREAGR